MRAYSILPHRFDDKRTSAILAGLKAAGFDVHDLHQWRGRGPLGDEYPVTSPLDLLVTWTRHTGPIDAACSNFEKRGGRVLVCEEAHIRHPIRKELGGEQHFCLSLHDHNGAGINHPNAGDRRLQEWLRRDPEGPLNWKPLWHLYTSYKFNRVLVREQRGIGSPKVRVPNPQWHLQMVKALQNLLAGFKVEPLTHPKNLKRAGVRVPPPEEIFRDVAALVTWNSHTGAEALAQGVPVVNCCPYYFFGGACRYAGDAKSVAAAIDNDFVRFQHADDTDVFRDWEDRRQQTFARYAWCQWSISEIRSGEAMQWLLGS